MHYVDREKVRKVVVLDVADRDGELNVDVSEISALIYEIYVLYDEMSYAYVGTTFYVLQVVLCQCTFASHEHDYT